jgi:hypothetical protein
MQVEAIKFSRHVIFCCTKSAPRFSLPGDFCNWAVIKSTDCESSADAASTGRERKCVFLTWPNLEPGAGRRLRWRLSIYLFFTLATAAGRWLAFSHTLNTIDSLSQRAYFVCLCVLWGANRGILMASTMEDYTRADVFPHALIATMARKLMVCPAPKSWWIPRLATQTWPFGDQRSRGTCEGLILLRYPVVCFFWVEALV